LQAQECPSQVQGEPSLPSSYPNADSLPVHGVCPLTLFWRVPLIV
jgi:hypothetical protein